MIIALFAAPWQPGLGRQDPTSTAAPVVELATFTADISPRVGESTCLGYIREWKRIERPLLAKGLLIRDRTGVTVVCSLDLCGVCNGTYARFRKAVATAAGTVPSRVVLHSLHLHTAPTFDAEAVRLLYADDEPAMTMRLRGIDRTINAVSSAVRSVSDWKPFTEIGFTVSRVDRVASSRRVEQPDGSILTRLSTAKDPSQRDAPEGVIDPDLRTLTFFDGDTVLAHLHFYATHPQTYPSDGLVTDDVPGAAREKLQAETGVFQMYLTGCGGNVAMGKYNDGSPARRAELIGRLYDAMQRGVHSKPRRFAAALEWRSTTFRFPARRDTVFTEPAARAALEDRSGKTGDRIRAATILSWLHRQQSEPEVILNALVCGPVRVVFLPGEPFVEFQLAAQTARPDRLVAAAGYTDCGMWYIGTDRMYSDRGGYEQTYALAGPVESDFLHAIDTLTE